MDPLATRVARRFLAETADELYRKIKKWEGDIADWEKRVEQDKKNPATSDMAKAIENTLVRFRGHLQSLRQQHAELIGR